MTARTRSLRLVGVNLIRINGDDLVAADCGGLRDAGAGYRVFSKDIPAAPSHAVTVYYLMVLAALGSSTWRRRLPAASAEEPAY